MARTLKGKQMNVNVKMKPRERVQTLGRDSVAKAWNDPADVLDPFRPGEREGTRREQDS